MKGLFLDLDGTLIETKSGETFPTHTDDWQFRNGMISVIAPYVVNGYSVHIVSNQGGIEAGFHTQEEITDKFMLVTQLLTQEILSIIGRNQRPLVTFQFCPVMDPEDKARKPNPGMLTAMAEKYGIDLSQSLMVGDMESDRGCAQNAGCAYLDVTDFNPLLA